MSELLVRRETDYIDHKTLVFITQDLLDGSYFDINRIMLEKVYCITCITNNKPIENLSVR
jgi:hypothetical protein